MKGFSIPDKWNDRRMQLCALVTGFVMALLTVLCMPIRQNSELPEMMLLSLLTAFTPFPDWCRDWISSLLS